MKRSIRRLASVLSALLTACVLTSPAAAQEMPSGKDLMEKHIQAAGGREAHEKIKNMVAEGTLEVSGLGVKGSFKSWHEGNKQVVEIDIAGIGKMTEGSDGKNAWSLSAVQGNRVKEGKELEEALFDGELHGELHWQKRYKDLKVVGTENVDGKPAYKVIATSDKVSPRTMYFDKESGLMVKVESKSVTPMGELDAEMHLSDYRKTNGIMAPFKNTLKIAGQELVITMDKISTNVDLPKDRFAIPAEIKELIK